MANDGHGEEHPMTRREAEEQANRDKGGKGFLHLLGLLRESNGNEKRPDWPEPSDVSFGGIPFDAAGL